MLRRRRQLIELHEQPWMPESLKILFRDNLAWLQKIMGVYKNAAPLVRDWLDRVGAEGYMDLCSGAGGPAFVLSDALAATGRRPKVRFSDLYPCLERYREYVRQDPQHFSFESQPFDAANSTEGQPLRARTVLSAFHHFPPPLAHSILADAVRHADGICIMEPFRRDLWHLINIPLSSDLTLFFPIFSGRRSGLAWLACLMVPIMWPIMWFDAAVSVLRGYNADELLEMAKKPELADFDWKAGYWKHNLFFKGTYLIGVRKKVVDLI